MNIEDLRHVFWFLLIIPITFKSTSATLASTIILDSQQLYWLLDRDRHHHQGSKAPSTSDDEEPRTARRWNNFLSRLEQEEQQQQEASPFYDPSDILNDLMSSDPPPQEETAMSSLPVPIPLLAGYDTVPLADLVLPEDDHTTSSMKPYVREFLEATVRGILVKTNLQFQLPPPLYHHSDHFRLKTSIPVHSIDLASIAYGDDDGGARRRRLTLKQDSVAFADLRETGVYKRGDYHITFSWYPGLQRIRQFQYGSWAECLYQWTIQVPSTLIGKMNYDQSVLTGGLVLGIWQMISGLFVTCNRLCGIVPTLFPKHSQIELEEKYSRAYLEWLTESQGFVVTATETIPYHGRDRHKQPKSYPVIFENSERGMLDMRPFVPELRIKVERLLHQIRQATEAQMYAHRMTEITSLSRSIGEEAAIERFMEMWHHEYLTNIEKQRSTINNVSSIYAPIDLTDTVLQQERARLLISRINLEQRNERQEMIQTNVAEWKKNNPVKATSPKFEDCFQAATSQEVEKGISLRASATLHSELETSGLDNIALMIKTQNEFEGSSKGKESKNLLESAKKSGIVEIVLFKTPGRWTVTEKVRPIGARCYELNCTHTVKVLSSMPLWRLQSFVVRSVAWAWNASFFLIHQASVALRRWNIFQLSFETRLAKVNHKTGEFDTESHRTIAGRLGALLDWKRNIINRARTSEHIVRLREGMYLDTCWAHVWTTIGVGVGGTLVTCATVLETMTVNVGALVALITSPIWSLVANIGRSLFNAFVYDCDLDLGEKSRSPMFQNMFGISTIILSGLRCVYHGLKGAVVLVGGEVRNLWNRTWHGVMTSLLRCAEIPTQAEGFFWSTSGPGMKTPFVTIDSDTALLALMAYLSQEELTSARQEMRTTLDEPRKILEHRVQQDSSFAMHLSDLRPVTKALSRVEADQRADLEAYRLLAKAERQYRDALSGIRGNSKIRMTEEQLQIFHARATSYVKKFYIERCFPRMSVSDIVRYWESRDLAPSDWPGLVEHIMSSIFTNEIVVPFEAASDDLVVEANRVSGLEKIIQEAMGEHSVVTGMSTTYNICHPIKKKFIPRGPTYDDIPMKFLPQPTKMDLTLSV